MLSQRTPLLTAASNMNACIQSLRALRETANQYADRGKNFTVEDAIIFYPSDASWFMCQSGMRDYLYAEEVVYVFLLFQKHRRSRTHWLLRDFEVMLGARPYTNKFLSAPPHLRTHDPRKYQQGGVYGVTTGNFKLKPPGTSIVGATKLIRMIQSALKEAHTNE